MKVSLNLRPFLLLSVLAVLLTSCEHLFEKDADYRYRIVNNTITAVEVVVEIKDNPSVHVQGDPNRYYTLEPGNTVEVWATSGFTDGEVHDEERKNTEIYWINVTASSNGRPPRTNLNSTSRWKYEKHSNYRASYTLTLADDDF